jgi:hypothetical protein
MKLLGGGGKKANILNDFRLIGMSLVNETCIDEMQE